MNEHTDQIDVYAIGWLQLLLTTGRCLRHGWIRQAWQNLRIELRYNLRQARASNWRAVRSSFGGYHAEHRSLGRRCGTGWTKRRALKDLHRHLATEATDWERTARYLAADVQDMNQDRRRWESAR